MIPPDRNPADVPECRCADVRRIRELNENNTKKFIEERKRQAVMQSRQMELLRKLHTDHADKLRLEMNSVCSQIFFGGGETRPPPTGEAIWRLCNARQEAQLSPRDRTMQLCRNYLYDKS